MTSILSERIRIKTDPASKFKNKTEIGRSLSPTKRGVYVWEIETSDMQPHMKADEKKSVHRYNTLVSFLSRPRLCASRPDHAKVKRFFCASCAVDVYPLLLSFSVCFQGAFQKYVHPSFSIVPRHCAPGALWLSFLWGCTETTTADLWPFFLHSMLNVHLIYKGCS